MRWGQVAFVQMKNRTQFVRVRLSASVSFSKGLDDSTQLACVVSELYTDPCRVFAYPFKTGDLPM